MSLLVGVFTALLSWYVIYSWKRRRLYEMAAKIPGPSGIPFFGEALSVIGSDKTIAFRSLTNLAKDYATPSRTWYGPYCSIIIDEAKDLQTVLTSKKCLDKAEVYKHVGMNKGLVMIGGNMWKSHRKLLDPAFNVNLLQTFFQIFNEKASILIREFDKRIGKPETDVYTQISACTLETLLLTMTGIDEDVQSDADGNEYLEHMDKGMKAMNDRIFKVWYHLPLVFRLSNLYSLYEKHVVNGIFAMADKVLKQRSEKVAKAQAKHKIFIDHLLSSDLSHEEVVDEINLIICAGHETSSLILSAVVLMLAMHPIVEEKLFEEVQQVSADLGDEVTDAHMQKLQYCEMVIKEAMRLFPVLPIQGRIASEDIELDKYTIPAGANIVISVYNAHRSPNNWGLDAEKFQPERFLPENISKIHSYAFIPFSRGPRMCIGWRYSILYMKTILFYLVKNYKFSTSLKYENLQYEIMVTLKIAQTYKVTLERRT